MRYGDSFTLNPITTVIQLNQADQKDEAHQLVARFVFTLTLAEQFENLLRPQLTFGGAVEGKGKLTHFRKEAIIAGFSHSWKTKQFAVIVKVAERIPKKTLREIHEFTQFYDIAKNRAPLAPAPLNFEWD